MGALSDAERRSIGWYVDRLREHLGTSLEEVWLFGSAARGDMWDDFWPMRSDVDLLVITSEPVRADQEQALLEDTYRAFLECGRTIAAHTRTRAELRSKWQPLRTEVARDGVRLWAREG